MVHEKLFLVLVFLNNALDFIIHGSNMFNLFFEIYDHSNKFIMDFKLVQSH